MAKIFNNINKTLYPAERDLNLSGWEKTMEYDTSRIPHITDTVGSGIALSKMGTSIPTPFARVFLFKTAFEMVNGSPEGADDNSAYGKLVSECLDFLEFIYGYGDAIEVKPWNVNANITALKNSPSDGHKVLGKCLENFALNLGVKDIYLIFYNGKLIGGTSPFTLVYTSPNWQREKNITNACGLAGNQLFQDYSEPAAQAVPLYKRHVEFRKMLTRYFVAFRHVAGMNNTAFFQYIYRNQQVYDNNMNNLFNSITGANPYDVNKFRADYGCLMAKMSAIDVLGKGGIDTLFLATKCGNVPPVPGGGGTIDGGGIDSTQVSDDYKIAATVDNGKVVTPLVLSDAGITGATYVARMPWTTGVDIERNPEKPLADRILPGGMNINYPYLTDTDFLQEKIIKVGYKVDTNNFMTFGISTSGEGDYLLPLRKEIFEYFKPTDFLDGNVEGLSIGLEKLDKESVTVHLFIPVRFKGHPYIELVHTYYKEDIVEMKSLPNLFSIGVFPSYKITDSNIPNVYSVLILDIKKKVTTRYYALVNGGVAEVEVTASKSRMKNGSRYEEINQAFDICEVEVEEAKALLIPNFKDVTPDDRNNVVVGIDFGTTNTYICYSTNNGADPHSLEISCNDMQVLMLNKIDLSKGNYGNAYKESMRVMPSYIQSLDREFAPLLLGGQSDVAYPFRTVVCETNEGKECFKNLANFQLFADINVGFNFLKEIVQLPTEKYNTNIKWDIEKPIKDEKDKKETPIRINRIKAYCQQTAWMIKNKLMLLDEPSSKFKVYLTFPYTMKRNVRSDIKKYWEDAFVAVMGGGNVEVKIVTESIAPYYTMVYNDGNFTKNALNIDIGGGTTDMLFADIENNTFYYTSSKFAGNDIWGDGKQKVEKDLKDNGFVLDFEKKLNGNAIKVDQDGEDNPKTAYFQYKNIVDSSADLMSYIFRYEDKYRYTDFIRQSYNKFLPILCIHLGAILYHVAQVLTEKKMTIPSTITFSGMGAKYIHILSTEKEDVQDIVKMFLKTFMASMSEDGKCNMPSKLEVSFQENAKEVTAQGAMLVGHDALQNISDYEEIPLCVYGVNEKVNGKLVYGIAPKYKDEVVNNFEKFIDMFLNNTTIINFFKEFDIEFTKNFIDTIKNEAEQSFDLMAENKDTDDINETMFFWPLKNGLYKASKL